MYIPSDLAALVSSDNPITRGWTDNYTIENNQWGADGYQRTLTTFCKDALQGGMCGWVWSFLDPSGGVMAFPAIVFGQKPWSRWSTINILPRKVKESYGLFVTLDYQSEGLDSKGLIATFNTAFDLWITKEIPTPTKTDPKANIDTEVMYWLSSQGAINPAGSQQASISFGDEYYEGQVNNWKCCSFKNVQQVIAGQQTVHLGAYLKSLTDAGKLDPELYLSSLEFGNEIWQGEGWTKVHKYVVEFK